MTDYSILANSADTDERTHSWISHQKIKQLPVQ